MPHSFLLIAALLVGSDPQLTAPPLTPAIDVVSALEDTLVDVIARVEPSVVAIAREKDGKIEETTAVRGRGALAVVRVGNREPPIGIQLNNFDVFSDFDSGEYLASDYGSGVVIGTKGEILTAFSVVRGASRLVVRAATTGYFDAEVIAADPRSDLAVIVPCAGTTVFRNNPRPPMILNDLSKLHPLPIGDATRLRKGNFLLALGNPFNTSRDGRASASWGILANAARRLDSTLFEQEPNKKQLRHYPTLLQLDAKLNLGMSGGAVVNLRGDLVGITTDAANAGGFDAQAGYAIPVDLLAKRAINALRQGREVEYGFLGIGLPDGTNKIGRVMPGTPAGDGGLVLGDMIRSIGGIPVVDADSLVLAVNAFPPGSPIKLQVLHEGTESEKTVTLSKLPITGEVIATVRAEGWRGLRVDFVSTNQKNNRGNALLDAMARGGVLVTDVQPGSAADDAEIKSGQVITAVEGQPIRTPAEFAKAVEDRSGPVSILIEGDQTLIIK